MTQLVRSHGIDEMIYGRRKDVYERVWHQLMLTRITWRHVRGPHTWYCDAGTIDHLE